MKLSFVGSGAMATAIARGLIEKDVWLAEDMVGTDISEVARASFADATGATVGTDNVAAVADADVVILAVKPQVAQQVLAPLNGHLNHCLFISIAAGVSLAKLSEWTGSRRVIRVMPNTPAMVGKGAAVYSCAEAVTAADRAVADRVFGSIGLVYEMAEEKLDAVTGVSGSGPAYFYEFIQAMVDGAVANGLAADVALELVVQTAAGAAEMLRQQKGSPDELRVAVTSPGGTTEAGLGVFAEAEFRSLVGAVITRATERSRELGRA